MNSTLTQSSLFSVTVHAFLLLPIFSIVGVATRAGTDVLRGVSSVELELIPAGSISTSEPLLNEGEEEYREERSAQPRTLMREMWLNDEGASTAGMPSSLRNPAPKYPWEARIRGWQGTVLVQVLVTPNGEAGSARVVQSSGYPVLDSAALEALRQWRFLPARRGERVVASRVEVPVAFKLETRRKENRS